MKAKRSFLAIAMAVAMLMLAGACTPMTVMARPAMRVTLHGEEVDLGDDGFILIDGRIHVPHWFIAELTDADVHTDSGMLPLRATLEDLGHTVNWDGATRTADIRLAQQDVHQDARLAVTGFMQGLQTFTAPPIMGDDMNMPVNLSFGSIHSFHVVDTPASMNGVLIFTVVARHTTGEVTHNVVVLGNEIVGFGTVDVKFETNTDPANAFGPFATEAVTVGKGTPWALDGQLTIPRNASAANPVPAVILVHGSGASNMDSMVFDNRPFMHIAEYLSSNGIAVLRYHKRTWQHGAQFAAAFSGDDFNIWHESVEDALLAAAILHADARIGDVYVAGLSLGAIIAPRIAEEGNLAGAIMLAGSPRPLFELSYTQSLQSVNDALVAGLLSQEEADFAIAMADAFLEEAHAMITWPVDALAGAEIFGLPALYQKSIYDSLPLPFIFGSSRPTLMIHGGRDFQISTEYDFRPMADATAGLEHVTALYFEGINHILMQSQTPFNDIRDYMVPGVVDETLLRAIVDWIMAQ